MVKRQPAPRIGVLALQGSFALHRKALGDLGVPAPLVRTTRDLESVDGLILPGGESTVMSDLARESGLFEAIRTHARAGLPVFGTCAGAILLGQGTESPPRLELAPVEVERNAYGRQRESFEAPVKLDFSLDPFPGIFIRAPRLDREAARRADACGWHGEDLVLARFGNLLLTTFHPELTSDSRIHDLFVELVRERLQGVTPMSVPHARLAETTPPGAPS